MTSANFLPRWAPKVAQSLIRRLYEQDALGILDPELIAEVGWALWERCDSILAVTEAHNGLVRCAACGGPCERKEAWSEGEQVTCPSCGWQVNWADYHRTYRGKQLFGANACGVFAQFHQEYPQVQAPREQMLLIDRLIHAFHLSVKEIGRPAAANLVEGSLGEVIHFLDALAGTETGASGVGDSRPAWRRTLDAAPWTRVFTEQDDPL